MNRKNRYSSCYADLHKKQHHFGIKILECISCPFKEVVLEHRVLHTEDLYVSLNLGLITLEDLYTLTLLFAVIDLYLDLIL